MNALDGLKGKRVTVVGLGESGIAAARLLDNAGAFVRVTEQADTPAVRSAFEHLEHRGIEAETGAHTKTFVEGSALVVVSPGVGPDALPVRWAEELGIPVISELELGYRACRGRIIAVTGTNGKSTVTTLIGRMLSASGIKALTCGNIGNAFCGEVDAIAEDAWAVVEVSSFQLERIDTFRPDIAVILNITDDHQDRYRGLRQYFDEKLKVFANQGRDDRLILNYDAVSLREVGRRAARKAHVLYFSRSAPSGKDAARIGAFVDAGTIVCAHDGRRTAVGSVSDIRMKGVHHVENTLAASLAASLAGAGPAAVREAIAGFGGLAHRFETVGVIAGVEFVDDSKSTTVDSTRRALESAGRPVVLIAGGRDKHSDYAAVRDIVKKTVARLVLIGEARGVLRKTFGDIVPVTEAATLEGAVERAYALAAAAGGMVLLSPMCSSFDMFRDYKERGDVFTAAVRALKERAEGAAAER